MTRRDCPRCGSAIPADAPAAAMCPRCMLAAGLDGDPTLEREARAAVPSPEELAPYFPELDVLELVGGGGMGLVYQASQRRLDRIVALKIIAPDVAGDAAFAERFTREARALAKLAHPNIVMVHDFGESGGLYYLLMEYVDGVNLRALLRDGRLAPEQALSIVPKICDALQYAHDRGVVHRDIKPENVLLTREGEVKIADFGLAKLARRPDDTRITVDDRVLGTPAYMAPEQIEQPRTVDHRADIYSLGVVFYEMLTGELPLGRFAPPSRKVHVDVRLDEVVLRTLEKERERRYQQAADVKDGITSAGAAAPEPPRPVGVSAATVVPQRSGAENAATAPQEATAPRIGTAPPPSPQRRLSRLALAGLLCSVFGVALSLAIWGPMGPRVDLLNQVVTLRFFNRAMIVGQLAGLLRLSGLGLSIAGWIAIARSRGRLSGLWMAIVGALLPFLVFFFYQAVFMPGFLRR